MQTTKYTKKMRTKDKFISARWVITQKYKDENIKYRGRLLARRSGEGNLSDIYNDSPTGCKKNFCLIAIVVTNKSESTYIIHWI